MERTERSFIKNGKNGTFFYKECKRTQRTERSFIKNAKKRKERSVLLKRTDAQPCKTWNTGKDLRMGSLGSKGVPSETPSLSHAHAWSPSNKTSQIETQPLLQAMKKQSVSNFIQLGNRALFICEHVFFQKALDDFLKYTVLKNPRVCTVNYCTVGVRCNC